jgi:hypothetical protein
MRRSYVVILSDSEHLPSTRARMPQCRVNTLTSILEWPTVVAINPGVAARSPMESARRMHSVSPHAVNGARRKLSTNTDRYECRGWISDYQSTGDASAPSRVSTTIVRRPVRSSVLRGHELAGKRRSARTTTVHVIKVWLRIYSLALIISCALPGGSSAWAETAPRSDSNAFADKMPRSQSEGEREVQEFLKEIERRCFRKEYVDMDENGNFIVSSEPPNWKDTRPFKEFHPFASTPRFVEVPCSHEGGRHDH